MCFNIDLSNTVGGAKLPFDKYTWGDKNDM